MSDWLFVPVILLITAATLAALDAALGGLEAARAWRARPAQDAAGHAPRRMLDGLLVALALLIHVPTWAALAVLALEAVGLAVRAVGVAEARPPGSLVATGALAGALAGAAWVGQRRAGASRRGALRGVAVLVFAALAGAAAAWSPFTGGWGWLAAPLAAVGAAVLGGAALLSADVGEPP